MAAATFLLAVERFLEEHLHVDAAVVARVLDEGNKVALLRVVGQSDAGEVRPWLPERVCVQSWVSCQCAVSSQPVPPLFTAPALPRASPRSWSRFLMLEYL